jgi:hypothetical protein
MVTIRRAITVSCDTSVSQRPVTGLWANQFRKAASYPMCRNVG